MPPFRWSEAKVVEAVLQHNYPEPWLNIPKFRPGTSTGQWAEKEFDCFCFHPWKSEGFARHVIEAKISRSDFLKEAKDPLKKRAGLYCATYFWFAAPAGVVRNLEEIPTNCGFYLVGLDETGHYTCGRKVPAPELADEPPTWNFLAAASRRVLSPEHLQQLNVEIDELKKKVRANVAARKVLQEERVAYLEQIARQQKQIEALQKAVKL